MYVWTHRRGLSVAPVPYIGVSDWALKHDLLRTVRSSCQAETWE